MAASNAEPIFHLSHLGGIQGLARWVRLTNKHPRAVASVVAPFRRGQISDEVRLLELAAAIEYWVAAHRRRGAWTKKGANPAEAMGHHLGSAFSGWVGDVAKWADKLNSSYNSLKHDPSYVSDPLTLRALQESASLALTAEVLNRVAGNKQPAQRIFADYRIQQVNLFPPWSRAPVSDSVDVFHNPLMCEFLSSSTLPCRTRPSAREIPSLSERPLP